MAAGTETTIRRLGPGDEDVVRRLATRDPQTALLADEGAIFFVYEVEVDETHRRRGIATGLMREALRVAGTEAFVLTDTADEAGNVLYRGLGGEATEVVQWGF